MWTKSPCGRTLTNSATKWSELRTTWLRQVCRYTLCAGQGLPSVFLFREFSAFINNSIKSINAFCSNCDIQACYCMSHVYVISPHRRNRGLRLEVEACTAHARGRARGGRSAPSACLSSSAGSVCRAAGCFYLRSCFCLSASFYSATRCLLTLLLDPQLIR